MPNFGYEPNLGGQLLPGSLQAPLSEISGIQAPSESYLIDPELPVVDTIFTQGQQTFVQISKFTAVGAKAETVADDSAGVKPYLTIAGGGDTDPNPIGVALFNLYKEFPNRMNASQPTYIRQTYLRYPFVNLNVGTNSVYNSNLTGTLYNGDFVCPDSFGRPVKYVPRKNITHVGVLDGSKSINVPSANVQYAPISNVKVFKINGTALTVASRAWDSNAGCYNVVTSDGAQNDVVVVTIDFGHLPTKVYGQVGRISTGRDLNSLAGWLRREMGTNFPFAPMVNPMLVTKVIEQEITLNPAAPGVTGAAVTDVNSDGKWIRVKVPAYMLDPTRTIAVQYAQDGTNYTTLANSEVTLLYSGQDRGPKFAVEPTAGVFTIWVPDAAATTSSKVKLTYSYDFIYPHAAFGANPNLMGNAGLGIKYLTDGTWTGGVENIMPNAAAHPAGAGGYTSAAQAKKSGLMHILVF